MGASSKLLVAVAAVCSPLLSRAFEDDAAVFVQRSVQKHAEEEEAVQKFSTEGEGTQNLTLEGEGTWPFPVLDDNGGRTVAPTEAVMEHPEPMVRTRLGMIRGIKQDGAYIFKGVPYAEVPERFAVAEFKKPWQGTLLASRWGDGCVSSHLGIRPGATESEDCLKMTIWVPPGAHKNLPVTVYFHGGQNQEGYAQDPLRQGDIVTRNKDAPIIFVSFDYRLGIFGWIQGYNVTSNLGLRDQQMALHWVKEHIGAFGGNPHKVTLWGHSEGANNIIAHLVSPLSKGLFHKAILHSPPATVWSRGTNKIRTEYIVERAGCAKYEGERLMKCLREAPVDKLMKSEWKGADLIRDIGSHKWLRQMDKLYSFERSMDLPAAVPSFLGWHAVPDGHILPHEPRIMIHEGNWNKVPIVITMTKDESKGVLPLSQMSTFTKVAQPLFASGRMVQTKDMYNATLAAAGEHMKDDIELMHHMVTDKVWTCDIIGMAKDMIRTGGKVYLEVFAYAPKYDPTSGKVNKECEHGASCHGGEMLFALPQGRSKGTPSSPLFMPELKFAQTYSQEFIKFIAGFDPVWAPFEPIGESVNFYDGKGPYVKAHYRSDQCRVLDNSVGSVWPAFYHIGTTPLPPLPGTTTGAPMSLKMKMLQGAKKAAAVSAMADDEDGMPEWFHMLFPVSRM